MSFAHLSMVFGWKGVVFFWGGGNIFVVLKPVTENVICLKNVRKKSFSNQLNSPTFN